MLGVVQTQRITNHKMYSSQQSKVAALLTGDNCSLATSKANYVDPNYTAPSSDPIVSSRTNPHKVFKPLTDYAPGARRWNNRKHFNTQVQLHLGVFNTKSQRIGRCCMYAEVAIPKTAKQNDTVEPKFVKTYWCENRFCPLCQRRKAKQYRYRFYKALEILKQDYPRSRWLFLTLSATNVSTDQLRNSFKALNEGVKKLWKVSGMAKYVQGYVISREFTWSEVEGNWNQHVHILLLVRPSYFTKGYLTQQELLQHWQDVLGTPYLPTLWIQTIKDYSTKKERGERPIEEAILEVYKYCTKVYDFIPREGYDPIAAKRLQELDRVLKGMRSSDATGVIRKAIRLVKDEVYYGPTDDEDDSALVEDSIDADELRVLAQYFPKCGYYVTEELSP